MTPHAIERLALPPTPADLDHLATLLVDAVESGAAVSFVLPLSHEHAREWWARSLASLHPRAIVLVAREPLLADEPEARRQRAPIIGTVQLQPAWAPNQPHRAELCKLIVHRHCQSAGLGTRLMLAAELAARDAGFSLLTLDAKRGSHAERLYRRLAWTHVGTIPRFALDPDGATPHDAVIFYKQLA